MKWRQTELRMRSWNFRVKKTVNNNKYLFDAEEGVMLKRIL